MPGSRSTCRISRRPAPPVSACSAPSCSSWWRRRSRARPSSSRSTASVLDAAGDRPVTFRTLDIGGDKVLPYMRNEEEENPALGWRAIRLGLDRPGLLRAQLRALLRAAGGRELRLMFPMIATVEEFDEAKGLVERELTHLRRHGHRLPDRAEVGTMVEVPSLLYPARRAAGSRGFPVGRIERPDAVPVRRRPRQQARRRTLRSAVGADAARAAADRRQGQANNKPVTMCGELASNPLGALALVAIGYRCALGHAVGGRPGQGHAARSRCRQGWPAARAPDRQPAGRSRSASG